MDRWFVHRHTAFVEISSLPYSQTAKPRFWRRWVGAGARKTSAEVTFAQECFPVRQGVAGLLGQGPESQYIRFCRLHTVSVGCFPSFRMFFYNPFVAQRPYLNRPCDGFGSGWPIPAWGNKQKGVIKPSPGHFIHSVLLQGPMPMQKSSQMWLRHNSNAGSQCNRWHLKIWMQLNQTSRLCAHGWLALPPNRQSRSTEFTSYFAGNYKQLNQSFLANVIFLPKAWTSVKRP